MMPKEGRHTLYDHRALGTQGGAHIVSHAGMKIWLLSGSCAQSHVRVRKAAGPPCIRLNFTRAHSIAVVALLCAGIRLQSCVHGEQCEILSTDDVSKARHWQLFPLMASARSQMLQPQSACDTTSYVAT